MRIEGTKADIRESAKLWFVCLLEIPRKYILDDLIFAKILIVSIFLPIMRFSEAS